MDRDPNNERNCARLDNDHRYGHNDHFRMIVMVSDRDDYDYDEHSLTRGRGPRVLAGAPRTPHTPPHILPDINNIIFIISGTDIKAYLFFKINISLL